MDVINKRRSIRTFIDKDVEEDKVLALLKAGMQAPSAKNQQPWEFIVVRDLEVRKALSNINPSAKQLLKAPVAIVLVINNDNIKSFGKQDQDMGACTQNILLEVVELGLAAFWIGVKPDDDRMKVVNDALELPDNIEPYAVLAVGYSDDENVFVDRFDESKIHYDKY